MPTLFRDESCVRWWVCVDGRLVACGVIPEPEGGWTWDTVNAAFIEAQRLRAFFTP